MFKHVLNSLFLFVFLKLSAFNQDSLRVKLANAKTDSVKIDILYKALIVKDNPARLNDSLIELILSFKGSNDCFARSYCYFKVGNYFAQRESPQKALDRLIIALRTADSCKNIKAIMMVRNKMAYVNKINENFKLAKLFAHQSLFYARQLKDSFYLADNYTLLGNMHKTEMQLDSALMYHTKALSIREKLNDLGMIALTFNNIGLVYKNKKEYSKALDFLRKSLALKIKIKDKTISSAYNNISIVFKNMKSLDSAVYYSRLTIKESVKYKQSNVLREGLISLAEIYDMKKDIAMALHYYKRLRIVEDSTNKETLNAQYIELQSKYESDKKDSELKLKEESLKTAEAMNSRKNIMIVLSSLAFILAIIAMIFIYRSYRQSKETAIQFAFKNKIIEEKNKEIMDSINYAKNIQQSLLTNESIFSANLKEHFILYQPKDVVSGDFYWAQKLNDEFLIMCADCTGHGVPGAFMSLLGIGYLKEIVNQKQVQRPDLILNELRNSVINSFEIDARKDGMDASLIKLKGNTLQMAAANNSVWIIRNRQTIKIKPDKFPIGKHYGEQRDFTLNSVQLESGDLVIMFTDGYADQFGGERNKKYMYKNLEKMILDNANAPLENIKKKLEDNIVEWKGNNEQIDDILVIGFRV